MEPKTKEQIIKEGLDSEKPSGVEFPVPTKSEKVAYYGNPERRVPIPIPTEESEENME